MQPGKFSFGMGDRFSPQGVAQQRALIKANQSGMDITPVWTKSNRWHIYVHSNPAEARKEADTAFATQGFQGKYFVDAETAGFLTLDVAAFIGKKSQDKEVANFRQLIHKRYNGASGMGTRYTDLQKKHTDIMDACVEENIYKRPKKCLFNL